MNRLKRASLLLIAALSGLASSGCIFSRMFYYNTPSLAAPEYFDSRSVRASPTPAPLPRANVEASFELTGPEALEYRSFDELLEANKTRAFLVLHNNRVVYERYFDGVTATTPLPGFSISKTLAAVLVGCAIDDGLLPATDARLVSLIPELSSKSGYSDITLDHLLRMVSGIDFEEESVAGAAMFYYSKDLRGRLYDYDVKWAPGTHYLYGSINTQLLWDALHRRLGGLTVAQYFEERVWAPLGAEHQAAWSLDSAAAGTEKLFSGFNASARDHARLGLLFLHGGTFAGRSVVPKAWITESLTPIRCRASCRPPTAGCGEGSTNGSSPSTALRTSPRDTTVSTCSSSPRRTWCSCASARATATSRGRGCSCVSPPSCSRQSVPASESPSVPCESGGTTGHVSAAGLAVSPRSASKRARNARPTVVPIGSATRKPATVSESQCVVPPRNAVMLKPVYAAAENPITPTTQLGNQP